jgi:hypothetical protein
VFITNHALAGAAIGLLARRPVVAFAGGLASHIAMDMVLHWGDERLDWDGFVEVAKVDGVVGLAVCAGLLAAAPPRARPAVAAGIAGACVIDMDKPGRHFFGRSPFPRGLDRFHARIQWQRPAGWIIEAGMAAGLVALLVSSRHRGGYGARERLPGGHPWQPATSAPRSTPGASATRSIA